MRIETERTNRWTSPRAITLGFLALALILHCATNGRYGYFRDELYFLACGDHLDWGYADHAPMIAWVARLSRVLFGDSLPAIRFFPALASAITMMLVGLTTTELGGRRFAVILACLCALVAPILLTVGNILTMVAFEPVFWTGCAYFLILAITRDDPRFFVGFGVLAGLGLETKHTMLFFGLAIAVGLIVTPARKFLRTKWFWIGGAISIALFLPNVIWEQRHGWATVELLRNVQAMHKNISLSPIQFLLQQILILLPVTAPVWIAGVVWLLYAKAGQPFRFLGIAFVVVIALMILLKGKVYYPAPIYPVILAAGAVALERLLATRTWVRVGYAAIVALGGAVFAPFSLPVLPIEKFIAYEHLLHFEPPKTEVGHQGPLPQIYGDQFGWPELVATVARIYHGLPPDERAKTANYCSNYGEAGAVDLLGSRLGLPKAICPHQTYFLWGPRDYTGDTMIVLQSTRAKLEKRFASVEAVAEMNEPYAMAEEHQTIFLCRGIKEPLAQLWPKVKVWN